MFRLSGSDVVGFNRLEVVTTIFYSRTSDNPYCGLGSSRALSTLVSGSVAVRLGCVSGVGFSMEICGTLCFLNLFMPAAQYG